jgi:hypothetical protein
MSKIKHRSEYLDNFYSIQRSLNIYLFNIFIVLINILQISTLCRFKNHIDIRLINLIEIIPNGLFLFLIHSIFSNSLS